MNSIKLFLMICLAVPGRIMAEDSASLQFSVAAPDPVVAGETVKFQTLTVNTGTDQWTKGTYYWVAEVYTIENKEPKFLAQTEPVTPADTVPSGGASGVQLSFTVPDTFSGRRLLYRVILVKDGRRILETDFKGFQVIEKKPVPIVPQDFKAGGDVSVTYKNSSASEWDKHQIITSANIIGKVKRTTFLFNTYITHTYSKPVTPTVILLNLYAPWGDLSAGDISPSLTQLSLDGQGMRGISYESLKTRWAFTGLVGRTVPEEDPTPTFSGRFSRYAGGGKATYNLLPSLKLSLDSVLSRDDIYSITIDTAANILKPQQSFVSGGLLEWQIFNALTYSGEYQASSYKADLKNDDAAAVGGAGYRQELRYRSELLALKAGLSRVNANFMSLASPLVIPDRQTYEAEAGVYPADWLSFSAVYHTYSDNLEKDPAKTATTQTQMNFADTLRLFESSMLNVSMMTNTALGKPAGVQNNKTTTYNISLMQPLGVHTINISAQTSDFKDKVHLSHDLASSLISINGSFRLLSQLAMSSGMVSSVSKDKVDGSSNKNSSLTGNLTYGLPRRSLAFQLWATLSSNKNNSLLTPSDTGTLDMNLETVWLKSESSKFTFGVGMKKTTDNVNKANNASVINFLTRLNYSF